MKLITEALVGMVITKINESVIYYVNGIFNVLWGLQMNGYLHIVIFLSLLVLVV